MKNEFDNGPSRREFLERIGLVTGGLVSISLLAACGEKAEQAAAGERSDLQAMNAAQFAFVGAVAEAILPRTDTPGARDAGVPEIIDELAANWMKVSERDVFLAGIDALQTETVAVHGDRFENLDPDTQGTALDGFAPYLGVTDENDRPHPFAALRELVIFGYYTSEAGATEELTYDPVPGPWQGCVDLAAVGGKAWSLQ